MINTPNNPKFEKPEQEIEYIISTTTELVINIFLIIKKPIEIIVDFTFYIILVLVTIYCELFLGIIKTIYFPEKMKTHHSPSNFTSEIKSETQSESGPPPSNLSKEYYINEPTPLYFDLPNRIITNINTQTLPDKSDGTIILEKLRKVETNNSYYIESKFLELLIEKPFFCSTYQDTVDVLVYINRSILSMARLGEMRELMAERDYIKKDKTRQPTPIIQILANNLNRLSQRVKDNEGIKEIIKLSRSNTASIISGKLPTTWSEVEDKIKDLEKAAQKINPPVVFPKNAYLNTTPRNYLKPSK